MNFLINATFQHLRMRRLLEGGVKKRKYGTQSVQENTKSDLLVWPELGRALHKSGSLQYARTEAMFTLYRIVKRSVAETDPVQCEQKQELYCVPGITSFENGAT